MKKQVWFRPDQAELVVEALKFVRRRCDEPSNLDSAAAHFSKRYVIHRIDEILELFAEPLPDVQPEKQP